MSDRPVVILCRTQMGENIGNAARAMLNFGLLDLRLVAPTCGWPNAKAVASASGAYRVLNDVTMHGDAAEAVADLQHVFATSARAREVKKPVMTAAAAALAMRDLIGQGRRVGLLFGPERTGLENDELRLAETLVSIPVDPDFASLNLAQAVLVMAYEWQRSGDATPAVRDPNDAEPPATKDEVRGLMDHLLRELERVEFFRSPDRRVSLGSAVEVLLQRRQLTRPEIHLFRGIIKELVGGRLARDGR